MVVCAPDGTNLPSRPAAWRHYLARAPSTVASPISSSAAPRVSPRARPIFSATGPVGSSTDPVRPSSPSLADLVVESARPSTRRAPVSRRP